MKVNYLISIFIILMLNKINAINCDSIDEHVRSLENSQITKLDNNSHLIIFFKANKDKKYYALIKEIPAYLSYIKCENNTIYFSNIRDNKFSYFSNLFQKSSIENTTINVINTNFTGYTDSLNKIYKLQSSIIEQNELRKYLQQGYDINLSEIPDTSDTSDTSNSNDSELMEGLLGDDSEMRKGLFDDDSEMRENFTNHYSLLDDNSPSTTDANSTIKPLKEIQWSQTEDALIPHDSSKFIEEYADHKYTNTNDLSTKFKLIKNVSSNDENLRFIKEKINELQNGEQIIIQILDQIDFKLDNILALKIKLNTPQHNEHTRYYDIDLFKYSRVIYSVKHVKIDVNIIHNSTEMSILHNDTSDHINFDAANIYIAKDTIIQQPLNEGLKLHPTANPETSSRKRPATLISEQQPVKKIKIGSTTQSTHSLDETVDNDAQNYDHINSCSTSNKYSTNKISNEVKLNYSEFFNPYSMNDYFDVNDQPFKYIGEFNHTNLDAENITNVLRELKLGQEIRMKFFSPSNPHLDSYYFAVRIRLKRILRNHRYYDLDFFYYKNLAENHEDNNLQMFMVSSECNTISFYAYTYSIEIRVNHAKDSRFYKKFTKTKLYISSQLSKASNEKQNVSIDDPTNDDFYKIKSKTQINEILSFITNHKKIETTSQYIVQNSQLIGSMSRLDSLNEDTLKLPYSNSIDEINPDTYLLTKEITLNKNKITTDQLTNYSEFFNIYSDNDYFDVNSIHFKYIKEIKSNDEDVSYIRNLLDNLIHGQELRMKLFQNYKFADYYFALRIRYINTGISRNYNVDVYRYHGLKSFHQYDNVQPFIDSYSNAKISVYNIKLSNSNSIKIGLNREINKIHKTNLPTLNINLKSAKIYIYVPLSMSNEQKQLLIDHNAPIDINVLKQKFRQQVTEILLSRLNKV